MNLKKNIEDFDLIFLDLETTGLDVVTGDAICEIGAFRVKQRKVVDKFHTLINPKRGIPKQAFGVHKISNEDVKDAPYFEAVADKFLTFAEGSIIFAYNVGFDIGFINHHLNDMNQDQLANPAIDILLMARDALELPRYNLEATAKFLKINYDGELHRALEDANLAYEVFLKLADIFKVKGIQQLGDFLSLYGLSNEIFILNEKKKISIIEKAIDEKTFLKLKCFFPGGITIDEKVMPLRIFQERNSFYLLCQAQKENTSRIKLNRILEVSTYNT